MKSLKILTVSILLVAVSSAQSPRKSEIIEIEKELTRAILEHDVDYMRRLYADDYVFIGSGSAVSTKTDVLNFFSSPPRSDDTAEITDMKVRLYRDTAVVNGVWKVSWVDHQGRTTDHDRFTDVFVRRNGKWLLITSQTTRISREVQPIKK